MFCTVRAGRDRRGLGRVAGAGLLALAALAVSCLASEAQQQDNPVKQDATTVLKTGGYVVKQGAKFLGFATDVDPPADFVQKSRPDHDLDYIPVFQPPPEPERPALEGVNLKAVKGELDALQKKHDALRAAYPPAAKALAEEQAAKKKPQTNAPSAQQ